MTTTTTPTITPRTAMISDQELLSLERDFWDAMKDRDARTAGRLTAEESMIVGASGASVIGPREIGKLLETAPYRIEGYRIDPKTTRIQHLCDDVVAISYGVHEDLVVDDKPVKLDAFDVSVWKKTANGWTNVLHTESIAGDAFGRDRSAGTRPS